jgi:uncharacterized repeat protein (TIGR01451 family)
VPGQIATFSGTYDVKQTDIGHGSIVDSSTATRTPPTGPDVTAGSNTVTINAPDAPSVAISKSANLTSVTTDGEGITYAFTVTNTGNETLTDVTVTDNPVSPAGGVSPTCQSLSSPSGPCSGATTTLAPGQIAIFTATYAVTQAVVDHGSIADTATATGDFAHGSIADTARARDTPPSGGTTTATSSPVTVEVTHISVVKSASHSGGVVAGSSTPIVYTLKVDNVGTAATTEPVVVTDAPPAGTSLVSGSPLCTGGPPACAVALNGSTITWMIPAGVVAGASYTLTFSVTADASHTNETITNTATWSGPSCGPSAATTSPTDSVGTTVSALSTTPSTVPKATSAPVAPVCRVLGVRSCPRSGRRPSSPWSSGPLCWSQRAGTGAVPVTPRPGNRTRTVQ